MSERIPEIKLQEIANRNSGLPLSNVYSNDALCLTNEVRRLRGVIVDMYLALEVEGIINPHEQSFDAFEDEARAIAEERGTPSRREQREGRR